MRNSSEKTAEQEKTTTGREKTTASKIRTCEIGVTTKASIPDLEL